MGVEITSGGTAKAPKLVERFDTDAGTAVGNLVVLSGTDTVTKITSNSFATIPDGIFGVGFYKPNSTTIDVIFSGIVGGYTGFTAGEVLYVHTDGTPTHTPPVSGMSQQIGKAVSTTEFFVQLMLAVRND